MCICRLCFGSIWRCSWITLSLAALTVVTAGCGFTPASWFEEDIHFVEAIPDTTRTRFERPQTASPWTVGDPAESTLVMDEVVPALNGLTQETLRTLELVVSLQPDEREENARHWGPAYSESHNVSYQLVVEEAAPGLYEYILEGDHGQVADPDNRVLAGEYGLDGDGMGRGTFHMDLEAMDLVFELGLNFADTVEVRHQLSDDLFAVGMDLEAVVDLDTEEPVLRTSRYAYRQDSQGGLMCLAANWDVDHEEPLADEFLEALARWTTEGAGRADGRFGEGNIPGGPVTFIECWDEFGNRTYWWDSDDMIAEEGDPASCPFADGAPPDDCTDYYPAPATLP